MAERDGIFISYRRNDSRLFTARVHDRLSGEFGREAVFRDVDDMPAGKFRPFVIEKLSSCAACIVVIGPDWLTAKSKTGERRLDEPDDLVRIEIETALKLEGKGLTVIPVMVGGAVMPEAGLLPPSLAALPELNGLPVGDDPHFHHDMDRLVGWLKKAGVPPARSPQVDGKAGQAAKIWETLQASSDVDALKNFIESFPETSLVYDARQRITRIAREKEAWETVKWSDWISVSMFVSKWPEHPRIEDAKRVLAGLPRPEYAKAALELKERSDKLNADAWVAVNWADAGSVRQFLADSPNHPRIAEAKAVLAKLEAAQGKPEPKKETSPAVWVALLVAALGAAWVVEQFLGSH